MTICAPRTTLLSGLSLDQLNANLLAAQSAYNQLMTGGKPVTVSYAQGDGNRSVTYTAAEIGALSQYIRSLQQALNMPGTRRRPLRMRYL
ncbi:MAG: gpW family protein [Proteobacteria bacterium]|nr:gpW family protein [Pseudomonadota bacterium]